MRVRTLVTLSLLVLAGTAASRAATPVSEPVGQDALAAGASWESIGPRGGPTGLLVAAGDSGYAMTAGGLVASQDGGRSWARLETAPTHPFAIAVQPGEPRHVWVAAVPSYDFDATPGGVFESRDGGATWRDRSAGLELSTGQRRVGYQFAFDPEDGTPLLATQQGLMRLSRAGTSWEDLALPGSEVLAVQPAPATPNLVLASVYIPPFQAAPDPSGILRSEDGGRTWNVQYPTAAPFQFVFDPVHAGRVLALAAPGTFGQILRSDDGGRTWTRLTELHDLSRLTVLADGTFFAASGHGVLRSRDGGSTWQSAALPREPLFGIDAPGGVRLLAAGERGIWLSGNGGTTFRPSSAGYSAHAVTGLAVDDTGTLLLASSGVLRSQDAGRHWRQSLPWVPLDAPILAAAPSAAGTFYVADLAGGGTARTRDGGRSWETGGIAGQNVLDLVVDPNDPDTIYAAQDEINPRDTTACSQKSTDAGKAWTCLHALGADNYGGRLFATTLAVRPGDSQFVLAANGRLARSLDAGATWSYSDVGASAGFALAVAFDPSAPQRILVGTSDGLWISTDDATHFARRGQGLPAHRDVVSLIGDPRTRGQFFAGVLRRTLTGRALLGEVYRSTDGGLSWRRLGGRLPREFTGRLALDAEHGALYAATAGRGAFRFLLEAGN